MVWGRMKALYKVTASVQYQHLIVNNLSYKISMYLNHIKTPRHWHVSCILLCTRSRQISPLSLRRLWRAAIEPLAFLPTGHVQIWGCGLGPGSKKQITVNQLNLADLAWGQKLNRLTCHAANMSIGLNRSCSNLRLWSRTGFEKTDYCKSTKFGVLFNLADFAWGLNLNRLISGKTSIIAQNMVNPPFFIAAK